MNITAEESDAIVALLQSVAEWGGEKYGARFYVAVSVGVDPVRHDGASSSWLVQACTKDYGNGSTLAEAVATLDKKCYPGNLHETKMAELKELERRAETLRKELAKIPKT